MKNKAAERNFKKIRSEFNHIENIVKHSKSHNLWEHEAAIRKKLRMLNEYNGLDVKEYKIIYNKYLELLNYASQKLLQDYNYKNNTSFNFKDIVKGREGSYLKSGVMGLLITEHIPKIVAKEFEELFPLNPKDEYKEVRKLKRKFYLHLGETNTGKTYNSIQRLKKSSKGIYLSPLRILALENYERLNKEGVKCNLITGEEEIIIEGAAHISCTIEKLNINEEYEIAIIDEIQMINDDQRGASWTRALLALNCKEIHICGAINSKELLIDILEDCGEEYEIKEYKRDIPLIIEYKQFSYKDVNPGDALVVFSKKRVLELGSFYSNLGIKSSMIYGDLPPEVRRKQYEQFINGESSMLVSTDAIGMGVNLPIRRIVFMEIKKFDGNEVRYLNSQEVKQIAGRAGRKGIYNEGFVASYGNTQKFINNNLEIKDELIESAVLGPSEEILKIKTLPLREKLALWSTMEESISYYRKMDIGEYLIILDSIKNYKLDEAIQWKLLKIPFDVSNRDIMNCFLYYMDEIFISKSKKITKPTYKFKDLYELETYYQKINLYYSFSKAFNLNFNEEWVYDERLKVSEDINHILVRI
ncbi:MAG TPA: RNA helicase [Clostridium sp.]|nr:RNA helicase [Clostridium sp.]